MYTFTIETNYKSVFSHERIFQKNQRIGNFFDSVDPHRCDIHVGRYKE